MTTPIADDVKLTRVRPAHRFDEPALGRYIERKTELGTLNSIQQFDGGQSNPTFLLRCSGGDAVMRKQPPGPLLPSAHQIDREHRVMAALADTPVPVPRMYTMCDDTSIVGTKFYLMEHVVSRLYLDPKFPQLDAAERNPLWDDILRVLAALHEVDYRAVGLGEFGRPGNYFQRQISRWSKQYVASKTEDIPAMDRLMPWLADNTPEDDQTSIVHGDYRIGNLLVHPTEPRLAGVLDWELSTLGHPLADLGYLCQAYYGDSETQPGLLGYDPAEHHVPSEEEVVARYCELSGRPGIDNWLFYLVYNMFRSAAIIQGVYRRGLDGNASSDMALLYKDTCRVRAEMAWSLVQAGK